MPRQMLRNREVRAPDLVEDDLTEAQLRAYPDDAAAAGQDLEQFTGALTSRIRRNANASDWRRSGTIGGGSGSAAQIQEDALHGDADDTNRVFTTTYAFEPQTFALYFNGLRQHRGEDADFVAQESGGTGSGFDTVQLTYAPGPRDLLWADYIRDYTATDGQGT